MLWLLKRGYQVVENPVIGVKAVICGSAHRPGTNVAQYWKINRAMKFGVPLIGLEDLLKDHDLTVDQFEQEIIDLPGELTVRGGGVLNGIKTYSWRGHIRCVALSRHAWAALSSQKLDSPELKWKGEPLLTVLERSLMDESNELGFIELYHHAFNEKFKFIGVVRIRHS